MVIFALVVIALLVLVPAIPLIAPQGDAGEGSAKECWTWTTPDGKIEFGTAAFGGWAHAGKPTLWGVIRNAEETEGCLVLDLWDMVKIKAAVGRPKDWDDLNLIVSRFGYKDLPTFLQECKIWQL